MMSFSLFLSVVFSLFCGVLSDKRVQEKLAVNEPVFGGIDTGWMESSSQNVDISFKDWDFDFLTTSNHIEVTVSLCCNPHDGSQDGNTKCLKSWGWNGQDRRKFEEPLDSPHSPTYTFGFSYHYFIDDGPIECWKRVNSPFSSQVPLCDYFSDYKEYEVAVTLERKDGNVRTIGNFETSCFNTVTATMKPSEGVYWSPHLISLNIPSQNWQPDLLAFVRVKSTKPMEVKAMVVGRKKLKNYSLLGFGFIGTIIILFFVVRYFRKKYFF